MKKIAIFISLCVIGSSIMAQKEVEKHLSFSGKEKLILNIQIADSIVVHTWNKQEVYAKASVNVNDNQDNDAYLTSFDESGKTVKISANFKDDYFKGKNQCCNKSDIAWTLNIPENTVFSIETINGNIIIDGATTGVKAKTISGFIDLMVTRDRKADLELKTITGKFYTDLDLGSGSVSNTLPQVVSQKLNNGGYPVKLETISGDIFVRKSK